MRLGIVILLCAVILIDVALTNVSFGLFSPGWKFDLDGWLKIITFSSPYAFTASPYEFQFLLLIRQMINAYAVILTFTGKRINNLFSLIVSNVFITYCFSLVKLLAFADDYEKTYYPGVWISVIWAILSVFIQVAVWDYVLSKSLFDYDRLNNTSTNNIEEGALEGNTLNRNDTENGNPKTSTWKILKQLYSYCAQQWLWNSAGFLALGMYALACVFIPKYTSQVIGDVLHKRGQDVILNSILSLCGLYAASTIFGGLRGGCFEYATALLIRQIRMDLYTSLTKQNIAFFDMTKSGETVSRLTSDCQTVSDIVSSNVNVILRNFVMLTGSLIVMLSLSWRLTTVTLIVIPAYVIITQIYQKLYEKNCEEIQDAIAKTNQKAQETLSTMRTVRSFACEELERTKFRDLLTDTVDIHRRLSIYYMLSIFSNGICTNGGVIAVLSYGAYLVQSDKLNVEELITFLLYQRQWAEYVELLSDTVSASMKAVGSSRKVFDLINRQPEFELNGILKPEVSGQITISDVGFTYPSRPNNPVLKNLTLRVEAGETVALVGPSGGGKSSIVSLIEHFYEPAEGMITIDGVPIKDIDHKYYHQKVSLVAQEPVLYTGSVRQNILYGCDFATEEDMLEASKMANAHDFIMELEKGYETECGEKGIQMSGGQKQRIAIARALVRNPAVLIMDEATSALDVESESLVQEAMKRCAKERTVIIIAHRLSTVEKADKIAVIRKGHIVQLGTHKELMLDTAGMYYSLVSRQMTSVTMINEMKDQ